MKVKLSHKLFAAFLCTSLLTVVAMVAIMQIFATRNFTDYVNRMEMEKLGDLMHDLREGYLRNGGWEYLRGNYPLWQDILQSRSFRGESDLPMPPPPPPPFRERFPNQDRPLTMPPGGPREEQPPLPGPPPPLPPDPFRLVPRISLLDDGQRLIVGNPSPPQEQILKAIEVDGKTVGWAGIEKRTRLSHPLEVEFARQQTRVFLLTGFVALCIAALVSFFLAGHLLRPIKNLIQGTQALSRREFATRVSIASHDELGQLASNFNNMAQALDRYELMRRQWLSDISHELRTPLSILRAEIEAMQDGVRVTTRDRLASLHSEILYLGKIVNDLHELSLADSAMLTINKEPVNLIEVLKSTLKSFETRFKDRGLHVESDLESGGGFLLAGDEDRLKQLFSNLLENTLRYANAPGILKIWHQRTVSEITLNFMDSGPGVPEESLGRLFDRLYRVDPSRTRERGGSGLGLAICKSVVEALGGRIKAANEPGAGLWISVVFPLSSPQ